MPDPRPVPVSEDSEEERAFLQTRVALFWKVIFFIILLGSGLGAIGAVAKPGADLLFTHGLDRQCRHLLVAVPARAAVDPVLSDDGERRPAARLDRRRAAGALPPGGVRPRSFARERRGHHDGRRLRDDAATGRHGDDGGDSRRPDPVAPRRTIIVTAMFGAPTILVATVVVPVADGGLAWRASIRARIPGCRPPPR